METSTVKMAPPPAMAEPATLPRSSNSHLFFDLPDSRGSRRSMPFCKDPLLAKSDSSLPKEATPSPDAPGKHWNLRDRKVARGSAVEEAAQQKKLRNMDAGGKKSGAPSMSVSLSRREIETDFVAITGKKPPRRPQKRPRNVQNQINMLCPGLSMSEWTADRYKVNEKGGF